MKRGFREKGMLRGARAGTALRQAIEGTMGSTREENRQIVETPTEARQAEPGPSVAPPAHRLDRAGDLGPRRCLACL
jgi:hypothetical protein